MVNQNNSNSTLNEQSIANQGHKNGSFAEGGNGIPLLDILDFVKKSHKIIMLRAFLGFMCSVGYRPLARASNSASRINLI
jgi:hypothetical protein